MDDIAARSQALFDDILHGIGELHLEGLGLINSITRLFKLQVGMLPAEYRDITRGGALEGG
jgi:hypothetical protein